MAGAVEQIRPQQHCLSPCGAEWVPLRVLPPPSTTGQPSSRRR